MREGFLFPEQQPLLGASGQQPLPGATGRQPLLEASGRQPTLETAGLFADVALNRPVRCEFTYRVPHALREAVACGVRVAVPLGRKREIGVVVALHDRPGIASDRIKPIATVLDAEPLVDAGLLELTRWIATYYACSWGEALSAVLPAGLKHEGGVRQVSMISATAECTDEVLAALEQAQPRQHRMLRALRELGSPIEVRDLCRRLNVTSAHAKSLAKKGLALIERKDAIVDPLLADATPRSTPHRLNAEQTHALDTIGATVEAGTYATFLLQGITGSGKTEVYLRVIERVLALGKDAIVIVPEIALTPQTVGWFRSRFGDVAVLHSRMTDAQRRSTWLRVKRGEVHVVVGARSAVFAPVKRLGVIVVDEEHEPSFKQSETPRYHARDVAVMRARSLAAVCILGSATPSLESWHNAGKGLYQRILLRERVSGGRLPRIEIVDLRAEKAEGRGPLLFSKRLAVLLAQAFARKEQSILFLNRRGFAPSLWCAACGETVRCKHCDVSLTFHRKIKRAVCHSCCEEIAPPTSCPTCTAPALRYLGAGSERIESALSELLPSARVRRMDSDTMLRRQDYEEVLAAFGRGEIDVLVGTQMIAKGLDFPRVTVVGIVSADVSLHLPDFRASERTFQLLAQVSGRAGRGELAGEIVVQTAAPTHPAILHAAKHDFEGFAAGESRLRAELGYPPHGRLVRVVFEDEDEARVLSTARACGDMLRMSLPLEKIAVLGPAEAPVAMLRGRHRQHLLLKMPHGAEGLDRARQLLIDFIEANPRLRITLDVDPVSML